MAIFCVSIYYILVAISMSLLRKAALELEEKVLNYWLGGIKTPGQNIPSHVITKWFIGTPEVDLQVKNLFEKDVEQVITAGKDNSDSNANSIVNVLKETPSGTLTLVILLDQFTRNIYRGTSNMYSGDRQALALSHSMIERKWDMELIPIHRCWIYLPLEHSEFIKDQELSVKKSVELTTLPNLSDQERDFFDQMVYYAKDHMNDIQRFGRFPYRNQVLGRVSTPEELEFLEARKKKN